MNIFEAIAIIALLFFVVDVVGDILDRDLPDVKWPYLREAVMVLVIMATMALVACLYGCCTPGKCY